MMSTIFDKIKPKQKNTVPTLAETPPPIPKPHKMKAMVPRPILIYPTVDNFIK